MGRATPLLLAVLALVLTAGPATAATTYRVDVDDNYYDPQVRSIARGDAVKWKNVGNYAHTVTANNGFTFFSSGFLAQGATYTKPFPAAGTFGYYCEFHPGQTGRVKVPIGLARLTNKIRITLASSSWSPSSYHHRIERKLNSGAWQFVANSTATSYDFTPTAAGTWTFRVRLEHNTNGTFSGWAKKSISW